MTIWLKGFEPRRDTHGRGKDLKVDHEGSTEAHLTRCAGSMSKTVNRRADD